MQCPLVFTPERTRREEKKTEDREEEAAEKKLEIDIAGHIPPLITQ